MPSHVLHELQEAARRYASHVHPGVVARRVLILDEYRTKIVEVMVPPCNECGGERGGERGGKDGGRGGKEDERVETIPNPQLRPGWDFSRAVPHFNGAPVIIAGRPLEVLKSLAEADGPVKLDDLRKVWGDYPIGDSSIRFAIKELRAKLKEQFPTWDEEMISTGPHGYRLEFR